MAVDCVIVSKNPQPLRLAKFEGAHKIRRPTYVVGIPDDLDLGGLFRRHHSPDSVCNVRRRSIIDHSQENLWLQLLQKGLD
jgi:hypothetical protein